MKRITQIRQMSDEQLVNFIIRYGAAKSRCERCAKKDKNCNPYTGGDCLKGLQEYFNEEGKL